jgi:prepilin-type N-terminal cleavage/methylation domain-containing protein
MKSGAIKGFTLIELIIAITILGLLAVALLAALDPIEQFNKARDTATRNTALEIHNAMLRYNASKERFPDAVETPGTYNMISTGPSIIAVLIDTGELKSNFIQAAGSGALSRIGVYNTGTTLYTCFRPVSKQFKTEAGLFVITPSIGYPNTVITPGVDPSTCASASTDASTRNGCAYCAQ